jgi:hypothetical protein
MKTKPFTSHFFSHLPLAFLATCLWMMTSCQSESEDPQVDCSTSSLALSINTVTNALCDQSTGGIIVSATGGAGNYEYSLNTGTKNNTGIFSQLSAGGYTVRVEDGDCSRQLTTIVNNEGGVLITNIVVQDSGCGSSNGSIEISANEGIPPYQYAIDNSAFQSTNAFNGLSHGFYTVRVTDSQNCEITQEAHVLSGISWASEISNIINTKCAIPTCHSGNQPPDYREFANVQAFAAQIKTRTGDGSMPPTGALPAAEVQAIACWVDDGAPNN